MCDTSKETEHARHDFVEFSMVVNDKRSELTELIESSEDKLQELEKDANIVERQSEAKAVYFNEQVEFLRREKDEVIGQINKNFKTFENSISSINLDQRTKASQLVNERRKLIEDFRKSLEDARKISEKTTDTDFLDLFEELAGKVQAIEVTLTPVVSGSRLMETVEDCITWLLKIKEICKPLADNTHINVNVSTNLSRFDYLRQCNDTTVKRLLELLAQPSFSSNAEILTCIFGILETQKLVSLLNILDCVGLSELSDACCFDQTVGPHTYVYSVQIPDSNRLQGYYYSLKNFLDNSFSVNRQEYLRKMRLVNKHRLMKSKSMREKTFYANRQAVTTWVRMQHLGRDTTKMRRKLQLLVTKWPADVSRELADIFVHSKRGVINAMEGNAVAATEHMNICYDLSSGIKDPLIRSFLCHDRRYTNQLISAKDQSASARGKQAVLKMSMEGVRYVQPEGAGDDDFCTMMKRIFWLYIAQHYLNIGNDLQVDAIIDPVSEKNLRATKATLHCFRDSLIWGLEVEHRRKMIYNVCQARVHEIEDKHDEAIKCLDDSIESAQSGAHFPKEIENTQNYRKRLLESARLARKSPDMEISQE